MHYGVTNDPAALCLILLAVVIAGALGVAKMPQAARLALRLLRALRGT